MVRIKAYKITDACVQCGACAASCPMNCMIAYPCLGVYNDSKIKNVTSVRAPPFVLSLTLFPPYYGYCNNYITNRNKNQ